MSRFGLQVFIAVSVHLLFSEAVCQPAESGDDSVFSWTLTPIILSSFPQTGNAHKRPSAALSHHLWLLSHFLSASLWISLPSSVLLLLSLSPPRCPSVCRKKKKKCKCQQNTHNTARGFRGRTTCLLTRFKKPAGIICSIKGCTVCLLWYQWLQSPNTVSELDWSELLAR